MLMLLFIAFNQEDEKPNILVIFGDDTGWSNTSIYNRGMMGYKTPNIDKIGKKVSCLQTIMLNKVVLLVDHIYYRTIFIQNRFNKSWFTRAKGRAK